MTATLILINLYERVVFRKEDIIIKTTNFCPFSFVKREGNLVTHALVHFARTISDELVWLEDLPS